MPTECSQDSLDFASLGSRKVTAAFDGGAMTSNAGALLLRETDRAIRLSRQAAACFTDGRRQDRIEHSVETLLAQRIHGIALGYEDLNDHDELRHDPVLGLLSGKLEARRATCSVLAGKSTLNRLEHAPKTDDDRYRKLSVDEGAMKRLFVSVFLKAHATPPKRIILDLDATDDPIHGDQEGRFFHGYYKCYCYLPLYIFCGRDLLLSKLRPANIDASAGAKEEIAFIVAQIRDSWPNVDIWLRADFRVLPRGNDGVVRGSWRSLRFRSRSQRKAGSLDRRRTGGGFRQSQGQRQARTHLQGATLPNSQKLVSRTPRRGQGGAPSQRQKSALHRQLADMRSH